MRNLTLAARLREVFLNGHWIAGTNYKAQLSCLPWTQATVQIENLNSIAALTFHVNFYLEGLLHAFASGQLNISDKFSFQLPPISSSSDWRNLADRFLTNAEQFAITIENMADSSFDMPFVNEKYGTLLRNVEGVIEHSYYHLGQIVIIQKLLKKAG